jgi:hypothetical protein
MKSIQLLPIGFALFLLLGWAGCSKEPLTAKFEVRHKAYFIIPANTLLDLPLTIDGSEENSNAEAQYTLNDTRKELLEEVTVKRFFAEIESPQNEDFDFLNAAHFYINAQDQPEREIAYKDPVPENISTDLEFDLKSANLAPYLKADAFTVRLDAVTDEQRAHDIRIAATAVFDVRARIID